MPFVLIIIGLFLLIAGARGTQGQLYDLIKGDFTGQNSFIYWIAAMGVIGGLGYIPALRGLSHAFLALVLIVLVLHQNTGIWANLTSALQGSTLAATPTPIKKAA